MSPESTQRSGVDHYRQEVVSVVQGIDSELDIQHLQATSKVLAQNLGEGPYHHLRMVTLTEMCLSRLRVKALQIEKLNKSEELTRQNKESSFQKPAKISYLSRAELFKGKSTSTGIPSHWTSLSDGSKEAASQEPNSTGLQDSLDLLECSEFDYLQEPMQQVSRSKPQIKIRTRTGPFELSRFSNSPSRTGSLAKHTDP